MRYVLKIGFILYAIIMLSLEKQVPYEVLAVMLITVASIIFKERYADSLYMVMITFILICIGVYMDPHLGVLFCISAFDFTFKKAYLGMLPVIAASATLLYGNEGFPGLLLLMGVSGMLAFVLRKSEEKELHFRKVLDDERRLRYELEQTKMKLLNSSREIASITEVKERNRIAREIHDSIGHRITGILVHLQASYKLYKRDEEKSLDMLSKSIENLSGTIEMIRDTVHNIKPQEMLGIEYIKSMINNFSLCPIDLKFSGNFNQLPAHHLEIIATNMKEALTNASRYSNATKMEIAIDANEQFTRIYIKDNGKGCDKIKEGLGLSGMKERVQNIGGSLTFSGKEGFLIVSLLPRQEGGGVFESSYRG